MPNPYHATDPEPLGTGTLQTPTLVARVAELEALLEDVHDELCHRVDDLPTDLWVKLRDLIGPHLPNYGPK